MTGVLFIQFFRFADDEFGPEIAVAVGDASRYAPTGDYDPEALRELARRLATATGQQPAELLRRFGATLFHYFARMYPAFFAGADSALRFLGRIETYIHGELIKLYPDAHFPHFDVHQPSADRLEMVYRSPRQLADLAEGLIRGCTDYFGEPVTIRREDLPASGEQAVRFVLVRAS